MKRDAYRANTTRMLHELMNCERLATVFEGEKP